MEKIKSLLSGGSKDETVDQPTGPSSTSHPTSAAHSKGLTGEGSHLDSATGANTTGVGALQSSEHGDTATLAPATEPHPDAKAAAIAASGFGPGRSEPHTTTSGLDRNQQASGLPATSHPTESTTRAKNLGNAQIGSGSGSIDNAAYVGSASENTASSSTKPHIGNVPHDQSALSSLTGDHTSSAATASNTHTGMTTPGLHVPGQWTDEADTSRIAGHGATEADQVAGSNPKRDVAIVGGAVMGAGDLGSGLRPHDESETGLRSTTGTSGREHSSRFEPNTGIATGESSALPIRTHDSASPRDNSSGSNLGRDAAVVGTATAVGTGVHRHPEHESDLSSGVGSTGLGSSSLSQGTPYSNTGYDSAREAKTTSGSHQESHAVAVENAGVPTQTKNVGALDSSVGSTGISKGATAHSSTHGLPHDTTTANLLDPSVNTRSVLGTEDAIHHSPNHGGGAEQADSHHRASDGLTGSAAALEATRQGAHGYGVTNTSGLDSSTSRTGVSGVSDVSHSTESTGPAPNTAGPHSKDVLNVLDPTVTPKNAAAKGSEKIGAQTSANNSDEHHYGRDAAVVGGLGTAAYAAGQHHGSSTAAEQPGVGQQTVSSTTQAPYTSISTTETVEHSTVGPSTDDTTKDSHHGRDAAVVGGAAGVATYEADKHSDEKELAKAQKEAEKQHKHELKEAEKEHKHAEKQAEKEHKQALKEAEKAQKAAEKEQKHAEKEAEKEQKHAEKEAEKAEKKDKKGGFLSFLHRDKSKKYTKEEEDDFDRQEREHNASQSNTDRNTALGGAAGVAGAGALYEVHHEKNKPAAGEDPYATSTTKTPLADKPIGKDLGDHLHGADRNRGVQGSSGFAGEPGFGDGTTGAEHGGPLHNHIQSERPTEAVVAAPSTSVIETHRTGTEDHYGRDAAVTGGVGGAALATGQHEHHEHEEPLTTGTSHQPSDLTGSHRTTGLVGSTTSHQQPGLISSQGNSGLTESSVADTTTGREFPLAGTGAATSQHTKHDSGYQYDNKPGLSTIRPESGLSRSDVQEDSTYSHKPEPGSKTSDLSGRNRLHKDPPADHPAAQAYTNSSNEEDGAHVPASGNERREMLGEGKTVLDDDTGVANATVHREY